MSYAVGGKGGNNKRNPSYSKVKSNEDEENMANPLLTNNAARQAKQVESHMSKFKLKLKQLEDFHRQIGTEVDNQKFRQRVEAALMEAAQTMKETS